MQLRRSFYLYWIRTSATHNQPSIFLHFFFRSSSSGRQTWIYCYFIPLTHKRTYIQTIYEYIVFFALFYYFTFCFYSCHSNIFVLISRKELDNNINKILYFIRLFELFFIFIYIPCTCGYINHWKWMLFLSGACRQPPFPSPSFSASRGVNKSFVFIDWGGWRLGVKISYVAIKKYLAQKNVWNSASCSTNWALIYSSH